MPTLKVGLLAAPRKDHPLSVTAPAMTRRQINLTLFIGRSVLGLAVAIIPLLLVVEQGREWG